MAELIYNIKNLFSTEQDGCLLDYDVDFFHIAAYQRGYKWGSDENGAVSILLNDLNKAYSKSINSKHPIDYYLQYITLKKESDSNYLEVIDGQQRLTTLSILLSVFSYVTKDLNIACNKLDYAVRANFFEEYVYNNDALEQLFHLEWDKKNGLQIDQDYYVNNQDTYYIFQAIKKCKDFVDKLPKENLTSFYNFFTSNVLIIVNVVEHVSSEKIFSNLNSNKVPLTESELIKALFITKYARLNDFDKHKNFREISEDRLLLGKRWDEIENWVNDKYIKSYYFKDFKDPMFGFLNLVALSIDNQNTFNELTEHHDLFNFFNNTDIVLIQEKLYHCFWKLKDWYEDPITYNRLGYLFFYYKSKTRIDNFVDELTYPSKDELKKHLLEKILEILPKDFDDATYDGDKNQIHQILLAINLFTTNDKFNFYSYVEENWTLEHIFPQSPEGKKNKLTEKDKKYIVEMVLPEDKQKVEKVLNQKERSADEKEIYTDALKRSGYINSIGNLCLLSNVDNILNGCGFYEEKRTKILRRIQTGKFIPPHTIEVFTKSIFNNNPGDFTRWNKENIDSHKEILLSRIDQLRINLNEQIGK